MSGIKFQTASTPEMTPEEFQAKQASQGGKFIREPGTYSLIVTGVEAKQVNGFDNDWYDFVFSLENTDGQSMNHFLSIPTTAHKSFMFGKKKSLSEYNKLEKFLLGFGVRLEYSTAITQIAKLFEDAADSFVGKQITLRVGFTSNHLKYLGKDGDISKYKIVDKNDQEVVPLVFKGYEAAEQYAKENNIKMSGFIRVLEVIPATTAALNLVAVDDSIPF